MLFKNIHTGVLGTAGSDNVPRKLAFWLAEKQQAELGRLPLLQVSPLRGSFLPHHRTDTRSSLEQPG